MSWTHWNKVWGPKASVRPASVTFLGVARVILIGWRWLWPFQADIAHSWLHNYGISGAALLPQLQCTSPYWGLSVATSKLFEISFEIWVEEAISLSLCVPAELAQCRHHQGYHFQSLNLWLEPYLGLPELQLKKPKSTALECRQQQSKVVSG